ncbi:MAG: aldose epimerase family protein [Bacteroidota bacterium]
MEGYFSDAYLNNAPYFGCTVGRYSSRIKDGKFEIGGQQYTVAVNDGPNHLHGGLVGFNKQIWNAEEVEEKGAVGVRMSRKSPDMEEGYPGNVEVSVTFLLTNDNELTISYEAETDKPTPLSLTNHSYFNLSGFKQTIENHKAQVSAKSHLKPDGTNVPVGEIEDLSGGAADLSKGKRFKEAFSELETGFEHYFLFDKDAWQLEKVAEFEDEESGRKLEISTTEPGMLFYSGYFTSDELKRENGDQYGRYRGFCCETHRYPNGPNIADSPKSVTKPGEKYTSKTVYKVSW